MRKRRPPPKKKKRETKKKEQQQGQTLPPDSATQSFEKCTKTPILFGALGGIGCDGNPLTIVVNGGSIPKPSSPPRSHSRNARCPKSMDAALSPRGPLRSLSAASRLQPHATNRSAQEQRHATGRQCSATDMDAAVGRCCATETKVSYRETA